MEQFAVSPNTETRPGRMLAAGRLTVTVKSLVSGKHITVEMKSLRKNDDPDAEKTWEPVAFRDASHLFVQVPTSGDYRGRKVGTYYPRSRKWYSADGVAPAHEFAAMQAFRLAQGLATHAQAEVVEQSYCGVCGRELTDPVSIERGIGPECNKKPTGSSHWQAPPAPKEEPVEVPEPGTPGGPVHADPPFESTEERDAAFVAGLLTLSDDEIAALQAGLLAGLDTAKSTSELAEIARLARLIREDLARRESEKAPASPQEGSSGLGRVEAKRDSREQRLAEEDAADGVDVFGAPLDPSAKAASEIADALDVLRGTVAKDEVVR